jgi:hypothetical protein
MAALDFLISCNGVGAVLKCSATMAVQQSFDAHTRLVNKFPSMRQLSEDQYGALMKGVYSPNDFERACGKGSSKKWKFSLNWHHLSNAVSRRLGDVYRSGSVVYE